MDQLLRSSRSSRGSLPVHAEPVRLATFVDEILGDRRGQGVRVAPMADDLVVAVDPTQVPTNLVDNALRQGRAPVEVSAAVTDDRRSTPGLGLGLPIAQRAQPALPRGTVRTTAAAWLPTVTSCWAAGAELVAGGDGMSAPPAVGRSDLVDALPLGLLVLDRHWRVVRVNPAAAGALAARPADLVGRSVHDVQPGLRGTSLHAVLERVLRRRSAERLVDWYPPLRIWVELFASPVAEGLALLVRDVTLQERDRRAASVVRDVARGLDAADAADPLHVATEVLAARTGAASAGRWARAADGGTWRVLQRVGDAELQPDAPTGVVSGAPAVTAVPGAGPSSAWTNGAPWRVLEVPVPTRAGRDCVVVLVAGHEPAADDWPAVLEAAHPGLVGLVAGRRRQRDTARLFELSRDLLVVVDEDLRLQRANPRTCAVLGVAEEDLVGHDVLEHVHPEDRAAVLAVVGEADGAPVEGLVARTVTADGRVRHLRWSIRAAPAERLHYLQGSDVTEELAEQRLADARDAAMEGLVLGTPPDETLTAVVVAVEGRLQGTRVAVHRHDERDRRLVLAVAPSVPDPAACGIASLPVPPPAGAPVHRPGPGRVVLPVRGSGGGLLGALVALPAQGAALGDDDLRVLHEQARVVGVVLEHERNQRRLRESEERFRLLATVTSDAIRDWDLASDQLDWNEGFEQLFGYDRDEAPPDITSWTSHIHPEDAEWVVADVHRAIDGQASTWAAEYRFLRADGSSVVVLDRARIIRDHDGAAVRLVGGMVDLTDQRDAEARQLRAQRMESIGTLAGGIAHDLNNMLAPVLMGADLLATEPLTEDQQRLVDMVLSSARQGAMLIDQVLMFARGAEGERTVVHPVRLVEDLRRMVVETFPRNLRVEVDRAGSWQVLGDAVQLQQVLLNLAVNARDAMPDGGLLTLGLEDVVLGTEGPARPAGEYVRLSVGDTGSGIAPEVRERIFEPFFTTKPVGEGTGLGLSTTQAIVESHGGFVDVSSEVGRGSTFRVHLPTHHADVDTPAGLDPGDGPVDGGGQLLLVVDDEPAVREVTARALEGVGYRVVLAENGAEAVGVFARRRDEIALVLTDLVMPVMDGVAVIEALGRIDPDMPVVVMSGMAERERHQQARELAEAFLAKPFRADVLLATVSRALEQAAVRTRGGSA